MVRVPQKFFYASMLMWIVPVAILLGLNHKLFPGLTHISDYSLTLLSGALAVISVNVCIAFYICLALKEPRDKHKPDSAFLTEAKASLNQVTRGEPRKSSQSRVKRE